MLGFKDRITKGRTSITVFPCIISLILTVYIAKGISLTHMQYGIKMIIVATIISAIWLFIFCLDQIRINKNSDKCTYIKTPFYIALLLGFFIGLYMACSVWGNGYLSLAPFEKIDNGTQHLDSLFHSSVAESYKQLPYATTMLNGEGFLKYHTFSHMIMGNISRFLDMPSLVTYCFMYPTIFLPLYLFSIFFAISSAKRYFVKTGQISFPDLFIITIFIAGLSSNEFLHRYGIWKMNCIVSESFLIASTLAFFGYGFTFNFIRSKHCKTYARCFILGVIPLLIFIITWAKISVGVLFATSVIYFIFRTNTKKWRFWFLNVYYAVISLAALWLFNWSGNGSEGTVVSKYRWLAFGEWCTGSLGIWGHYLILLFLPVTFVVLEIVRKKYKYSDFSCAKTVWIEITILVCIIAFLPGFIMEIPGGSAAYFSYFVEVPALILLCGNNYLDFNSCSKTFVRALIYVLALSWCVFRLYTNKNVNPISTINSIHESDLCEILLDIRDEVDGNPEDYMIYIGKDSLSYSVFQDEKRACYVYPAITGVGVINASYYQGGNYYSFLGESTDGGYFLNLTDNVKQMKLDEAIIKAKNMGKKNLIYVTGSEYKIIDFVE